MKNCIRPHYEKLKPLKSGFIENSNFENNRDPCIARPLSVYLFCTPGKEYHSQADLTSQSCYSVNAKSLKAP